MMVKFGVKIMLTFNPHKTITLRDNSHIYSPPTVSASGVNFRLSEVRLTKESAIAANSSFGSNSTVFIMGVE